MQSLAAICRVQGYSNRKTAGGLKYRQLPSGFEVHGRALKEKTVTISFRVSESAFKALQDEAKKHNISLNTLVNQMFVSFAEYDRYLARFGLVKVGMPTFKKIMNAATDSALVEAGRLAGSSLPESFIMAKRGELSLENALEYLRLSSQANMYDYSEVSRSGTTSVTLTHDLGAKGSIFIANYAEAIFKSAGKSVKITQYPDSVTIEVGADG